MFSELNSQNTEIRGAFLICQESGLIAFEL
jgi:hypothetical protein